jgi:hypothetical protein
MKACNHGLPFGIKWRCILNQLAILRIPGIARFIESFMLRIQIKKAAEIHKNLYRNLHED